MDVSLLIPIKNGEKFLDGLFACIESQTRKDFQLIFYDDASTDGTRRALYAFAEGRGNVTVLGSDRHIGLQESRRTLIDNCRTGYTIWADCDDWFSSDYMESLYNAITHSDADCIHCPIETIRGESVTLYTGRHPHAAMWGKAMRTEKVRAIYGRIERADRFHDEDWIFHRIAFKEWTYKGVKAPLYRYYPTHH